MTESRWAGIRETGIDTFLDNAIHTGRSDYVRKKENSNG